MNNIKILTFTLIIILFTILATFASTKDNFFIAIKINNQIITNLDIENEKKYLTLINVKLKKINEKQLYRIAKESLIREVIKAEELIKFFEIKDTTKYTAALIKELYTRLNMQNENELKQYFGNQNIKIQTVKQKLNIEALWNILIYQKYIGRIKINEDELKKKIIANNKKNPKEKKMIKLSEIIFNAGSKNDNEDKYKKILKSISQIGFANTANIYSDSPSAKLNGEIGWVSESQISKTILENLDNLKVGEFSKLINTPSGSMILKIDNIKKEDVEFNLDIELNKLITYEKEKKLNQYSIIFFQNLKNRALINEE